MWGGGLHKYNLKLKQESYWSERYFHLIQSIMWSVSQSMQYNSPNGLHSYHHSKGPQSSAYIGSVTNHQKRKLYWETRCGRKTMWKYGLCCPLMTLRTYLGVKEIGLVELVHLLQEDEGKNCVRPKTSVIRSETLPQTEESFVSYDLHQYLLKKEKVKKNERKAGSVRDYH